MVKNESFSNDLNFVKEFEELKLKQKLLIEALNSKNKTEMNRFLLDVNSKLDFLVKIFKESQELEEEDTFQDDINKKIDSIIESLKSLEEKLDSNIENFDTKFINLNKLISKTQVLVEKDVENSTNNCVVPNFKVSDSINGNNKINEKDSSTVSNDENKKKRKWF